MSRIIGHMVTRNERDRYLATSLAWLVELADQVHVYDDCSIDGSDDVARKEGALVDQRPTSVPSFAEHEGRFRQAAWGAMEERCEPTLDDWVLSIDADEYLRTLRTGTQTTLDELHGLIADASEVGCGAIRFRVAEVFDLPEESSPRVRVDSYWGQITACRLVRWRPKGTFSDRSEGCGSVPADWTTTALPARRLAIMHLGYATEADRRAKYERYAAGTGHNPDHIESILTTPTLASWSDWAQWDT